MIWFRVNIVRGLNACIAIRVDSIKCNGIDVKHAMVMEKLIFQPKKKIITGFYTNNSENIVGLSL